MKFFINWETDKGDMMMPIKASNKKEAIKVLEKMQENNRHEVDYILIMHDESGLPTVIA